MISFSTIVLRLIVALLLGAVIGFEREYRQHVAGMRTTALISLGSALFTIISAYGFFNLLGVAHIQLDPTRIASYVIAGIGFLGGGVIFFQQGKERVRGLTTAAAIWVIAAIGMACGAGLLWEAVTTTFLALAILIALRYLEQFLLQRNLPHKQSITIEIGSVTGEFLGRVYDICRQQGVTVEKLSVHTMQENDTINITCQGKDVATLADVVGELHNLPGVRGVHFEVA
jgi:putative Mg2+ transporter-C (MgtC) family protein